MVCFNTEAETITYCISIIENIKSCIMPCQWPEPEPTAIIFELHHSSNTYKIFSHISFCEYITEIIEIVLPRSTECIQCTLFTTYDIDMEGQCTCQHVIAAKKIVPIQLKWSRSLKIQPPTLTLTSYTRSATGSWFAAKGYSWCDLINLWPSNSLH